LRTSTKGVFGAALMGGLVAGNIVCFGTDPGSCSNGGRVALGVTDGVFGACAVLALVLWSAWRNFRGD